MRTIKFRGRDPFNNNWYYGLLCKPLEGKHKGLVFISNEAGMPFAYVVRPDTVGQFTGLTDKNGTEIFEGDIISIAIDGEEHEKAPVEYKRVSFEPYDSLEMHDDIPAFTVEVIGNIHENPELLK